MSQYYYNPFQNNGIDEATRRAFLRKQQEEQEKKEIRRISLSMGLAIIAYLLVQNIFSVLLVLTGFGDLYSSDPVFQCGFTIIAVSFSAVLLPFGIMALANKKKYETPIVPNNTVKPLKCIAYICFGMLCCIISNFVVSYVSAFFEALFGITFNSGTSLEPDSVFACVMEVIATAIIPAVCEEFAMRCCSLQLLRKYGKGFAVLAVSIVFGLLHANVTQFIFAFLIGLVLGFVTIKTDSIVPAVLIHAFNNGMSVFNSIAVYAFGEDASSTSILICYIFWAVLGIAATIYLFVKGELKGLDDNNRSVLTTSQKFTAFLFPWMIVPFFILIVYTISTISLS